MGTTRGYHIKVDGKNIPVTPTEFRLFSILKAHQGTICTKRNIKVNVFGWSSDVESRGPEMNVVTLRRKLIGTSLEDKIESVRGVGYRMKVS